KKTQIPNTTKLKNMKIIKKICIDKKKKIIQLSKINNLFIIYLYNSKFLSSFICICFWFNRISKIQNVL
ncbi:MAG: hypothetical protein ACRYE7_00250, partial [Janthinobacterium lividum]